MRDALAMLAAHLRVDRRSLCAHGLKDRRAVTHQHVSLPWACLRPERLEALNAGPGWDGAVQVGDLLRQERHCEPGGHKGNEPRGSPCEAMFQPILGAFEAVYVAFRFTVALRDVSLPASVAPEQACEEIVERLRRRADVHLHRSPLAAHHIPIS